ncbi:hypothetical protein ABEF95_013822 [Exophiala dermatitidis]
MNLFTIQQNPSKFSWTSSEATTRTPSHSWKSSSTTRHSPASTSGTEYNSPKSSHSVTGSPKHDRPEGSSSAVLSRTQSSSKLSWSLLKTKLSDSKRTLTGVGVDRKQHPSSSKSAYPSPTKTRLKVSPPIPIIPERPEPLLLDHPLLDFCETETGQSHNDTSKKNIVDDTAEFEVARSSPELADLDADKRGNEFERIHRGGWTRVLPKEWVEEEFSDDDSKDTELTRSVYSQDNGEEESRRDVNDRAWPERRQRLLSKDSDSNVRSDAGPERLDGLEVLEKDSKPNGTILARHDGTRLEPLRKSARNPFRRKAVPIAAARADRGKGDSREVEGCERSTSVIRDIPTTEHDTQRGASQKYTLYQPVAGAAEYASNAVLTFAHHHIDDGDHWALSTQEHAEQTSTTSTQDQRGLEHSYRSQRLQEPLIPLPLRIKRHRETDNAEKRPSKHTEPNHRVCSSQRHKTTELVDAVSCNNARRVVDEFREVHEDVGDGVSGSDNIEHPLVTDINDILDMYLPQNHLEQEGRYDHSHQKQQNQNKNQNQVLKSDPEPQPKTVRRDKRNEHHQLQPQLQDEQDVVLGTSLPRHITTKDHESHAMPTAALSSRQNMQTATTATNPYPLSLRCRPPLVLSRMWVWRSWVVVTSYYRICIEVSTMYTGDTYTYACTFLFSSQRRRKISATTQIEEREHQREQPRRQGPVQGWDSRLYCYALGVGGN